MMYLHLGSAIIFAITTFILLIIAVLLIKDKSYVVAFIAVFFALFSAFISLNYYNKYQMNINQRNHNVIVKQKISNRHICQ